MQSTITECPFYNTDQLAECAEDATSNIQNEFKEKLQTMTTPGQSSTAKDLDDLLLTAINATQNETIRRIVCRCCDKNSACHPDTQAC